LVTVARGGGVVLLALLLIVGATGVAAGATATVQATVNRDALRVGEQLVLDIAVQGATAAEPQLQDLDGFTARYLGPSTQVSIVNGRVNQSITHRYALVATRPGRFTLGPFAVTVDGKVHRTKRIPVRVAAAAPARPGGAPRQRGSGPDVTLTLTVSSDQVYLHERIPLTLTLFVGERVDEVQYPRIETDAVSIEPLGEPVRGRTVRGGKTYRTLRFDTSIVPLRAGAVELGPARQAMSLLVSRRRGDPFFDRFFGSDLFSERRPHEVQSNTVGLTVRPLPEAGRPPEFSGAVGQFDLQVSAQPTEVAANDPVTVTMRIAGTGNLSALTFPSITGPGLKTYPRLTSDRAGGHPDERGCHGRSGRALRLLRSGGRKVPNGHTGPVSADRARPCGCDGGVDRREPCRGAA
jgi:hypothetical protein